MHIQLCLKNLIFILFKKKKRNRFTNKYQNNKFAFIITKQNQQNHYDPRLDFITVTLLIKIYNKNV